MFKNLKDANELRLDVKEHRIKMIESSVIKAVELGHSRTYIPFKIPHDMIKILQEKGYALDLHEYHSYIIWDVPVTYNGY